MKTAMVDISKFLKASCGITSHISAPFVSRQQIMGKAWLVI